MAFQMKKHTRRQLLQRSAIMARPGPFWRNAPYLVFHVSRPSSLIKTTLYGSLLLLTTILSSCTDHRLRPLDPQQMRLKTSNNITYGGFSLRTTYTYDINNRVAFLTTSTGSRANFQYDAQGRYRLIDFFPNVADMKNGDEISFAYHTNDNNFMVYTGSLVNGSYTTTRVTQTYTVVATNRITGFYYNQLSNDSGEKYYYTGDNVTRVDRITGQTTQTFIYTYDSNPNPYYGLIAVDIGGAQRLSRNNILSITDQATGQTYSVNEYTYNSLGLPILVQDVNGPGRVEYTYESY